MCCYFWLSWNRILSIFVFFSILFTWKGGRVANLSPKDGGYASNRWNSDEYCCLWKDAAGCKPMDCHKRFSGPDYAVRYCRIGDVWPDCVAKTLMIKESYYVSMIGQLISFYLLGFKGKTMSGFLVYVVFLKVNF